MVLVLILVAAVDGSEENLKVVSARDILAKINNGEPVEYNHTTITGSLVFGKLDSQIKTLPLIKITDSIIIDNININNVMCQGLICFNNTEFKGDVNFIGTKFDESAAFENVKFDGNANFRGSKFDKYTCFRGSYFYKDADFSESEFDDIIDFRRSRFKGAAYIENTTFNKDVYLDKSHFIDLYLEDTIFNCTLHLNGTKYEKIQARFNNIKSLAYNEDAYIFLANNFKKIGFNEDANQCYYYFRVQQLHNQEIFNPLNYFSYMLLGFGMRPSYPIIWGMEFTIIISLYLYRTKSLRNKIDPSRRLSYFEAIHFSISRIFKFVASDWEPIPSSKNIVLALDGLGWVMYTVSVALLNKAVI